MEKKNLFAFAPKAVRSISREHIVQFTSYVFIAILLIVSVSLLWQTGLANKIAANIDTPAYIPVYLGMGAVIATFFLIFIIRWVMFANAKSAIVLKTRKLRKQNLSTEEIRKRIVEDAGLHLKILTRRYTRKAVTEHRMKRTARRYIPLTQAERAEETRAALESPPKLLTHSPASTNQEDGDFLEASVDILTGQRLPSPRALLEA
ncbi:hypothetical protein CL638_01275 [bacterium]|nr:hypothetical protein [bacterium]